MWQCDIVISGDLQERWLALFDGEEKETEIKWLNTKFLISEESASFFPFFFPNVN